MYYVENVRDNYARTIGCATIRRDCKNIIQRELDRFERKGITKVGEFVIRNERMGRIVMRVKGSKNTWNKKEFADSGLGEEL